MSMSIIELRRRLSMIGPECPECRERLRWFAKDLRPVVVRLKREGLTNMATHSPPAVHADAEYIEKLARVHLTRPCLECGGDGDGGAEALREALRPIIIKLKELGLKHMATISPASVAYEAGNLQIILDHIKALEGTKGREL